MSKASVKIDDQLKARIERILQTELRYRYPTIKHFVDNAVLDLLRQIEAQQQAETNAAQAASIALPAKAAEPPTTSSSTNTASPTVNEPSAPTGTTPQQATRTANKKKEGTR